MDIEIQIRVAVTEGGSTRHALLSLAGSRGTLTVDDEHTQFRTGALWPTLRGLLPEVDPLVADPAPERVVEGALPEDLAARAVALVVIGIELPGEDPSGVARTWLATDDSLYAVEPGAVREFTQGTLSQTLLWDVTGAMEELARRLGAAS